MRGKVIEVLFEEGEPKYFNSQNEFKDWYVDEMHYARTRNCNLYQMLKGTCKSYQKHGIKDVHYVILSKEEPTEE